MEFKRLIVLTKSRMKTPRQNGFCVTGISENGGEIVRLVSNEQGDPVFPPFCDKFELLDIIEVQAFKKVPIGPQTENYNVLLKSIRVIGHYNDSVEKLYRDFKNCLQEKSFLENEDYKVESVEDYHHSLELVRVKNLVLSENIFDDRKNGFTTASFKINDDGPTHKYYRVTDKIHEHKNLEIGDAIIVVSIPKEPYVKDGENKGYFKFVAAIYEINNAKK